MKIALVTPDFPPKICGVGDYSFQFVNALRAQGCEVGVWTSRADSVGVAGAQVVEGPWGLSQLLQLSVQAKRFGASALVVQYTPQIFAPQTYGVAPWLVAWFFVTRFFLRLPVVLVAHELHYPVGFDVRGLVLGVAQWLQYFWLCFFSSRVFFTYAASFNKTKRLLPWKKNKMQVLPVGSNIPKKEASLEKVFSISEKDFLIFHFGGAHPTHLYTPVFEAFEKVRQQKALSGVPVKLICAGISEKDLLLKMKEAGMATLSVHLGTGVVAAASGLSSDKVSALFSRSDFVLSFFMDGISTRRGSFMAALEHGKPVVTNLGWASDRNVRWGSFCHAIAEGTNEKAMAEQAALFMLSTDSKGALCEKSQQHYLQNFSWPVLATSFLKALNFTKANR